MSFDVIGRRECVSDSLSLPHVLRQLILAYMENEVIPFSHIPYSCSRAQVLGIWNNSVLWKDDLMLMLDDEPLNIQLRNNITYAKSIGKCIVCWDQTHIFVYNIDSKACILQNNAYDVVVCGELVYFIQYPKYQLCSLDVTTLRKTLIKSGVLQLTCFYDSINVRLTDNTIHVLYDTMMIQRDKANGIQIFENRHYVICTKHVYCVETGERHDVPSNISKAVGFDGFIYLECWGKCYAWDLRRCQLLNLDRPLMFLHPEYGFHPNDHTKHLEVFV